MSCYEWESGTITLPSTGPGSPTQIKAQLRAVGNEIHEATKARTIELHKKIGTRSLKKYKNTLNELEFGERNSQGHRYQDSTTITEIANDNAFAILRYMIYDSERQNTAPRQPTIKDISTVAPKYTNRDNTFYAEECSIEFNGRTVNYNVPENNHARERADKHPLVKRFWGILDRVTWTRGTGGVTWGNDEYTRDSGNYPGGGANYIIRTYGNGKSHRNG